MKTKRIKPLSRPHDRMRQIMITLIHNAASRSWSVEINGERYDHVTIEIIEALVEYRLILAETSLTSTLFG